MLQELNISGNQLKTLPDTLGELSKLVVLRAHSNSLASLPDFKKASSLRVIISPVYSRFTSRSTTL